MSGKLSNNNMAPKVLILGAGITGALCASALHKALPLSSIKVWDKARGPGGRMTTTRSDNGNKADLGAQYITTTHQLLQQYATEYQPLLLSSTLSPLTAHVNGMKQYPDDVSHFIAPEGMGSVVKHILSSSSLPVSLTHHVNSITQDGRQFTVKTQDGATEVCDVVISTIPVPQLLNLPGTDVLLSNEQSEKLKQVTYSARFVLILYFDQESAPPRQDWAAQYLDDQVFRYVALDNVKRNRIEEAPTAVFHTSVGFGAQHIARGKADVEEELIARARSLFPEWPAPAAVKCHKWLYSQVIAPYPGSAGCLLVSKSPTLILAGDAFTNSGFNGCIASARAAVETVCTSL